MAGFINEDFLLQSNSSKKLYHHFAEDQPIIDYHCHLNPALIANDHQFRDITEVWLEGDHYKWRAMRTNGVAEKYCTGNASPWEKFQKWAETVPYTLRNPLFHWTHLELERHFVINKFLGPDTAREIFDVSNEMLSSKEFSCRNILSWMNVEVVCTTDDPIDDLKYHKQLAEEGFAVKVLPTFRPDRAVNVGDIKSYNLYLNDLSEVSGIEINTYDSLLEALKLRHDYFHQNGCRLSDHGLKVFTSGEATPKKLAAIFSVLRSGKQVSEEDQGSFMTNLLWELAKMDHEKGWVQQYHYGALRSNNTRLFNMAGPDTGFDSMGDSSNAANLSRFLDHLDSDNRLTKTILYNLNPSDNEMIATMIGNFQDGSFPGKIQFGSGWWFQDQKDGMERQMNVLSLLGLLSRFVGMLTDSRSFLSYPRHEYFRRILCNMLGDDMEKGLIPNDLDWVGKMVSDISYNNARSYFGFLD
jgi:glucuronate isomerase